MVAASNGTPIVYTDTHVSPTKVFSSTDNIFEVPPSRTAPSVYSLPAHSVGKSGRRRSKLKYLLTKKPLTSDSKFTFMRYLKLPRTHLTRGVYCRRRCDDITSHTSTVDRVVHETKYWLASLFELQKRERKKQKYSVQFRMCSACVFSVDA